MLAFVGLGSPKGGETTRERVEHDKAIERLALTVSYGKASQPARWSAIHTRESQEG
jgi:hypothetical protein